MLNKKVCVLIPYYNAGEDLLLSLNSLREGEDDVDIILVDDGSVEKKAHDYLKLYAGKMQVTLIECAENKGIEYALNTGLEYCLDKYQYIARLDCGDVVKNNRIKKQVSHLNENPDIAILGAWADFVTTDGGYLFTSKMPTAIEIDKKIKLNNMFIHPTVMMRSSMLKKIGLYSYDFPAAEDYEYFYRAVSMYRCDNLQESLLDYVVNDNSISTKKRKRQLISRLLIQFKYFTLDFSSFYGVFRTLLILVVPRSLTLLARRYFKEYKF